MKSNVELGYAPNQEHSICIYNESLRFSVVMTMDIFKNVVYSICMGGEHHFKLDEELSINVKNNEALIKFDGIGPKGVNEKVAFAVFKKGLVLGYNRIMKMVPSENN